MAVIQSMRGALPRTFSGGAEALAQGHWLDHSGEKRVIDACCDDELLFVRSLCSCVTVASVISSDSSSAAAPFYPSVLTTSFTSSSRSCNFEATLRTHSMTKDCPKERPRASGAIDGSC